VTLTFPDQFIQRAQQWAARARCDVTEIIARAATLSLPSLEEEPTADSYFSALTDAQVLALTHQQMDPAQDARLSILLERQQAALLNQTECAELDELMSNYEIGLLRKAEALAEAVRRRLREPPHP